MEDDLADEADAVAALPGVAAVTPCPAVVGMVEGRNDPWSRSPPTRIWTTRGGSGRSADPGATVACPSEAADELALDELLADRARCGGRRRLTFTPYLPDELEAASDGRSRSPVGCPAS